MEDKGTAKPFPFIRKTMAFLKVCAFLSLASIVSFAPPHWQGAGDILTWQTWILPLEGRRRNIGEQNDLPHSSQTTMKEFTEKTVNNSGKREFPVNFQN